MMRHLRFAFFVTIALLMACSPQSAPTPAPTSTLEAINLAGPEMKLGSTYLYVDGAILVPVPAGPFTMGSGGSDNPEHQVTLSDFWIYSAKATNQQYALCVNAGQCAAPDPKDNPGYDDPTLANNPVVGVTYDEATAYCSYVHARLPTEAEWEKTARGPTANIYPWGNGAPSCDLLNFNNCVGKTSDVTKYPQGMSFYQALDMEGNAQEWAADWYDPHYYPQSPIQDPPGPSTGQMRVVRSSSYKSNGEQVPVPTRFSAKPGDHRPDLGFRCVVTQPTYFAPSCQRVMVYGLGPDGKPDPVDFPVSTCPTVSIKQVQTCVGKKPQTNVIFVAPDGATLNTDSCLMMYPHVFICSAETTVSVCAECSLTFPADSKPGCPSGWHTVKSGPLAGEACEPDSVGTPGKCLPGVTYDPAKQCCTAAPAVKGPSTTCPVGTYYVAKLNKCLPAPVPASVCVKQTVSLKTCGGGAPPPPCSVEPNNPNCVP